MPHRKDLGSQGRRPNRRRAIHLTEFLRGDNEPTPRDTFRQNESQNQTISSSIGELCNSGVTVSPVVSPITSSDEQEKALPPLVEARQVPEVKAWDMLLSDENVQTDDPYLKDNQEFPDLGSQAKRVKTRNATNPFSSATQSGLVLGNFLPEFLQLEEDDDNEMAMCLSSDEDFDLLQALQSGPRNYTSRKRTATIAGPSHYQRSLPSQIIPDHPAAAALLAEQQQQQKRPHTFSQQQQFLQPERASSKDNTKAICRSSVEDNRTGIKLLHPLQSASRNHTLRTIIASIGGPSHHQRSLQPQIIPDMPAATVSLAEQQQRQERPHASSQQQLRVMSATRLTQQIEFPQSMPDEEKVIPETQVSVEPLTFSQSFWEEVDEQSPAQTGEGQTCGCLLAREEQVLTQPSFPPIRHSTLNANAQEFRPRARMDQVEPVSPAVEIIPHRVRLSRRRRRQRNIRSFKGEEPQRQAANEVQQQPTNQLQQQPTNQQLQQQPTNQLQQQPTNQLQQQPANEWQQQAPNEWQQQAPNEMPQQFYEHFEHEQRGGAIQGLPTVQMPIMEQNNSVVSQSVFRLASLPSTGVGTTVNSSSSSTSLLLTDISSTNPLPSSISGLTSGAEMDVVGSTDFRRNLPIISQDLLQLYDRPLLDMDRKDTQEEEEEPESDKSQQWTLQLSEKEPELPSAHPDNRNPTEADHDATVVCLDRNLMKTMFRAPAKHGKSYPQPDLNCVPAAIKKLHKLITSQYSDYSFVYALSGQLGQDCVPMECYVYLKMILLASLVSIEPDELRPPISLCIVATDSLIANRLMNSIGQLAPRFLGPHEYGLHPNILGGPLSSTLSRYNWVVASPLLLAQQGVYYAGDWTRLSKEHAEQIEKCIENGAVPVPQLQTDQALEAAIWTHWQPENSNNQSLALAKLCPIFGLPIYMGEGQASGDNDSLWNFLLRQHTKEGQSDDEQQHQDGLHIPEEDMRLLLHLLHQRKVTFEDRAQHMLQKYYVIARKERPTVFTSKTYIVLKQFAESFAKLALRLQVLESDVCLAIFHCEHFTQQIFGGISDKDLTAMPPPMVNSFRVISHIDPYMNEFGRWLLQYLDRYEEHELGMHKAKRRRTNSWGFP